MVSFLFKIPPYVCDVILGVLDDHLILYTRMFGEDVERCELTSCGMEKMKWGCEGVEP